MMFLRVYGTICVCSLLQLDSGYPRCNAGGSKLNLVWPLCGCMCDECVYKHAEARGVWGHAHKGKFLKIRCSEIASEAIFVSKC